MSGDTPRLTIGLPVYNGARYLRGALDSLLSQTMADFELIVSDNASNDDTPAICREYAERDERIRVFRNERNVGAAGNFNLVLELARAPFFKWAAYDDLCAPEFLDRCVSELDRDPDLILAYPRTGMIDAAGEPIGLYADDLDLRAVDRVARYRDYHARFRRMGLVNVLYGVIRTDVLRLTPGIAPYANSDVVLIGELALRGRFGEVPETLFLRRDHPMMTVRAFPSVRNRAEYLDPARSKAKDHPYLRMVREHFRAVQRVPMAWHERVRAYLLIGQFIASHALEYAGDRVPRRHQERSIADAPPTSSGSE